MDAAHRNFVPHGHHEVPQLMEQHTGKEHKGRQGNHEPIQQGRPAIELGGPVTAASPNSDGVFEIFCDGRATWDLDACIVYLAAFAEQQETLMDELQEHVYQLRGSPGLEDDFLI